MGAIFFTVPAGAAVYYAAARRFSEAALGYLDYLVLTTILALVVTGGYQLFFWVQRNNYYFPTRCPSCRLDDYIPFWPWWVWPYNVVYTLMLGAVLVTIRSLNEGLYIIFSGVLLLVAHSLFAMFFPCTVPAKFRDYKITGISTRYLKMIQKFDNKHSAFPSMHCSLATFVGLRMHTRLPLVSVLFIVFTPVACLMVKQHQLADTIGGVLLGAVVFYAMHAALGI